MLLIFGFLVSAWDGQVLSSLGRAHRQLVLSEGGIFVNLSK